MSLIYSSLHLEMPVLVSTLALPAHSFPPPPPPLLIVLFRFLVFSFSLCLDILSGLLFLFYNDILSIYVQCILKSLLLIYLCIHDLLETLAITEITIYFFLKRN